MKSQRRQVGGRYLARVRDAFRGGQARLRQPVGHPANLEADGATRTHGGAKRGQPAAPDPARGKYWDLAFHFLPRVAWSHKVSS